MDLVAETNHHNISMLDNIMKIVEMLVSDQMPQTKRQSKQLTNKSVPGTHESQVHVSATKQMVFTYRQYGLVYAHIVPKGIISTATKLWWPQKCLGRGGAYLCLQTVV